MVVLKNDYSHCPLKKRPLSACYDGSGGEQTEPQDLSLKCAKEATTLHSHESLTKNVYPQDSQISSTHADVSCGSSNTDSSLLQRIPSPYPEDSSSKRLFMPNVLRQESRSKSINVEGSSHETHALDLLNQRRFAQVIRTHDSTTQMCKKHVPSISLNSESPISKSAVTSDGCASPKHNLRQKDLNLQVVSNAEKHRLLPDGNEKTFSLPANPMGTLGSNTCSKSHSTASASVANECIPHRVPPLAEIFYPPCVQSGGVPPFPISASRHNKTMASPAEPINGLSSKCSSQNSSAPHRPWLVEGPARALPKPYTERLPVGQAAHSGSLIVGPPRLWSGMVPFTWPMPPVLVNPQPPSPRRHSQQRECYSPGSESASSDGSSGSMRSDARYSCTECSKSYSTYSGLSKHKQFHCVALGAKSFACKHCEKVYTSLGALKMHIRTHTLPCKCPLCGKAFSRPWLLQGHIRTHTGEKPFQCSQCDRCFADRSNLRAHLQTHADIKKYACNTCHKTFSRMSLLNKHTEAACPAIHRRTLQ